MRENEWIRCFSWMDNVTVALLATSRIVFSLGAPIKLGSLRFIGGQKLRLGVSTVLVNIQKNLKKKKASVKRNNRIAILLL